MSTISNKFFIQVLEDGKSLHGQLLSLGTITQAFKDGQCIPDWSNGSSGNDRPLIYLSLLNGSTPTAPDAGYVWKYNGTAIAWSGTTSTVYIGTTQYTGELSSNGKFIKTTYNSMPALGIIGNIAASDNTDIDVIRFEGSVTLTSNAVDFACDISVTITKWTAGGYLGLINFSSGNVIFEKNQSLTATAKLYNDSGEVTSGVEWGWFYEGSQSAFANTQEITITEASVTDYVIIRCEFYMTIDRTRTTVAVAYASVDDQQDPEFMWIKSNGSNGNTTSLRSGQSVTMSICVGTADDPTALAGWDSYKIKILDSEKQVVSENMSDPNLNNIVDGYRVLPAAAISGHTATFTIYYADVFKACKKGMTGIVVATKS